MINEVRLIGNVGKDPEIKYLENNTCVGKFSVATSSSYKDKKGDWQTQTEWHDVVAWRQLAEKIEKQVQKGTQVYVEGKLTHRKYTDKDGVDRYVTEIVANKVIAFDKKKDGVTAQAVGDDAEFPTVDDLPF